MPQAVAGAIIGAVGATGAAAIAIQAVVFVAISWGLGRLSQSLAGKANRGIDHTQLNARTVTIRGTVEPMQLIYGEVRAPGIIVWYGTSSNPSAGSSFGANRYLHLLVAYAGHQCESITDVWLDSRHIADADIDADGNVTSEEFDDGGSRLVVRRFLGGKSQASDSSFWALTILESDEMYELRDSMKGAGVSYIHYRFEKSEKVWPQGVPQNLFALIKGRRLYDPRKDSTNGGSGSHRYTDATTWEWSNNPTLCRRDYITGGSRWYDDATPEPRLGFADANVRIDDAYVIASANIDDQNITVPDGSGTTTQRRYTCDTQLSCGASHRENLEILNSSCAGSVGYVNGKYRIRSGAYDQPEVDLDEDDILGPVTVTTHPVGEDLYNFVTGTFFDEDRDWTENPFPSISNGSYESEDGGQYRRSIQLHATRGSYRAQRIAILHLAKSRHKIAVNFERLSPKAMSIAENDTFTVTIPEYGWDEKVFRCTSWSWLTDGFVSLTAREEFASSYNDPSPETYVEPGEAVVDTPEFDRPDTPTNFTVTPRVQGLLFEWRTNTPVDSRLTFHLYEHTADTPFSSATRIWSGKATSVEIALAHGTTRYYWVTAELNGVESEETPAGNGTIGTPGQAGTDDIDPNAATVITTSQGRENLILPTKATSSDPYDLLNPQTGVHFYTFTPQFSGIVIVEFTALLQSTWGGVGFFYKIRQLDNDAFTTVKTDAGDVYPAPTSSVSTVPLSLSHSYTVLSGVNYTFSVQLTRSPGTPDPGVNHKESMMRVIYHKL